MLDDRETRTCEPAIAARTSTHPTWTLAATVVVISIGVALHLGVVDAGLLADDYIHRSMIRGEFPSPRGPLELFTFLRGDALDLRRQLDAGTMPWWTAEGLHGAMARPLTSLLLWLDGSVAPRSLSWLHAHSLLWWGATLASAAWFLRRSLGGAAALLALLLFALDEGAVLPVLWPAHRGELVAASFGFAALAMQVAPVPATRRRVIVNLVPFALALAGGEYALGIAGFMAARVLLLPRGQRLPALRSLWPVIATLIAYVIVYVALDYGTMASEMYASPFASPARFGQALVERLPRLVGDLYGSIPAESALAHARLSAVAGALGRPSPPASAVAEHHGLVAVAVVAACAVAYGLVRPALSSAERRRVHWLALGSLLALIPVAVAPASGRLTMIGELGSCAVLATMLVAAARRTATGTRARRTAALGILALLAVPHLVGDPWAAFRDRDEIELASAAVDAALPDALARERLSGRDVVVVSAPEQTLALAGAALMSERGLRPARSWRALSMLPAPFQLRRVDAECLELRPIGRGWLTTAAERLFRPAERGLRAGEVIDLEDLRVEVVDVSAPERVRFCFAGLGDEQGPVFVVLDAGHLRELSLPAVGETLVVPRPSMVPRAAR